MPALQPGFQAPGMKTCLGSVHPLTQQRIPGSLLPTYPSFLPLGSVSALVPPSMSRPPPSPTHPPPPAPTPTCVWHALPSDSFRVQWDSQLSTDPCSGLSCTSCFACKSPQCSAGSRPGRAWLVPLRPVAFPSPRVPSLAPPPARLGTRRLQDQLCAQRRTNSF